MGKQDIYVEASNRRHDEIAKLFFCTSGAILDPAVCANRKSNFIDTRIAYLNFIHSLLQCGKVLCGSLRRLGDLYGSARSANVTDIFIFIMETRGSVDMRR